MMGALFSKTLIRHDFSVLLLGAGELADGFGCTVIWGNSAHTADS